MWTAHSKKGTNFFKDGRYNKLYFGTYFSRGRGEKISTKLRANTDPKKGILKSGRPCACYTKLHSPNNTQNKKPHWVCTYVYSLSVPYGLISYNKTVHNCIPFPHSSELEITQDIILVLKNPSKPLTTP